MYKEIRGISILDKQLCSEIGDKTAHGGTTPRVLPQIGKVARHVTPQVSTLSQSP